MPTHRTPSTFVTTAARLLLGAGFLLFGLNGFFGFLPMPQPPERAGAFLGALAATGYMFPLIKSTEILCGIALLAGRAVPLALVVLAPVVVNILAYHLVLDPGGLPVPLLLAAAGLTVAWGHRDAFAPLLAGSSRVAPVGPKHARVPA